MSKSTTSNDDVAKSFAALLNQHRASPGQGQLTNFTFWCGAGFSKSWDPSYPTGANLFSGNLTWEFDFLPTVCGSLGLDSRALEMENVKDIVYALTMYRKYPDLRPRYVDEELIAASFGELIDWVQASLEHNVKHIGYLSPGEHLFTLLGRLSKDQGAILRMFEQIFRMSHGGDGHASGVRPHFLTTNYDFVIETIIDSHLGDDDSLFLYTYRGFTPTSIKGANHHRIAIDNWLSLNLLKLNGGLEIRSEGNRFCLDYSKREVRDPVSRPKLILPSREQDYSDGYFIELFRKCVRLLRETKVLIIVGYSFPDDDAVLRFLVRQFAESAEDALGKSIFYVDLSPRTDCLSRLFSHCGFEDEPRIYSYTGRFGKFAEAVASLL